MKVSLNTVKQYIDVELPPVTELVDRLNRQLGGVEDVVDLGAKYKDALIVRVVECVKHPDADRLNVTKIDDGGVAEGVERDENGLVQVVCGAPNVHADMWAVWLPPGSTVPASYDDAEPFVLGARELRGVMSNGMLAASDELAIGGDHDGIVELTKADLHEGRTFMQGARFAEVFGLDDTIIDIENKMFTHRPDLFGQLGVAREISAILQGVTPAEAGNQDTRYENLEAYWRLPQFESATGLELTTFNDAKNVVPRVMFVAMKDVAIKPSPLWLQCALVAMGSKPINNIVDATNYIMLLTAQPTHAYDYDKLRGGKIGARMAQASEKITLLNGKTYELTPDDIVIADAEGPVGLGGIMGGADSEVDASTTNIVLEVATFDMYAVRKSSMRHGVFTDALTRFNKGQSPLQNNRVLAMLMELVGTVSPAVQASDVRDEAVKDWTYVESLHDSMTVGTDFINARLGSTLTGDQMGNLLRRVNFASWNAEDADNALVYTAPFWRTDIECPEDIVEEVGRLYGYDKLPRELPRRSLAPVSKTQSREIKSQLRRSFEKLGANEVLTYSFVHEQVLTHANQNPEKAFRIGNALSPDLQYYRLSVLPSLLSKVHANIRAGHDTFTLYEIGKGHHKDEFDEDGLPKEFNRIAAVTTAKNAPDGAPYYAARQLVEQLAQDGNFAVQFTTLADAKIDQYDALRQMCAPFEPSRAALVMHGEQFGGVVGELRQSVLQRCKLPAYTAACELFLSLFEKNMTGTQYRPLSKFPSLTQDISLKVTSETSYDALFAAVQTAVRTAGNGLQLVVQPVTIYQSPDDTASKTITLRITATSHERTLREDDVSSLLAAAATAAHEQLGAERI